MPSKLLPIVLLCLSLLIGTVWFFGGVGIGALVLLTIALLFGLWAWNDAYRWLLVLAFSIPLSMDVPVVGGVRLSVIGEVLSISIFFVAVINFIFRPVQLKKVWAWFRHPLVILLLLDVLWSGVSAVFSDLPMVSLKRFALKLIYVSVYFIWSGRVVGASRDWIGVFSAYALGMLVPIGLAIFEHSIRGFSQVSSVYLGRPFFADHTIYAACIAFVFPFTVIQIFNKRNNILIKGWCFGVGVFFAIALLLSYSRAAWISIFVAVIVALLLWVKVRVWQVIAILAGLAIVVMVNFGGWYSQMKISHIRYDDNVQAHLTSVVNLKSDASNLERINRWVSAIRMGQDRPILGFGPGTYQFKYDAYQLTQNLTRISTHHGDKGNAHSEYLGAFAETGLVGLTLLLLQLGLVGYLLISLVKKNLSYDQKLMLYAAGLGLISFYVHGAFNSFLDTDKVSFLVYVSLAIVVSIDENVNRVYSAKPSENKENVGSFSW